MADDPVVNPEPGVDPTPPPTPDPSPAPDPNQVTISAAELEQLRNQASTAAGRASAAQRALNAAGYDLDDNGAVVQIRQPDPTPAPNTATEVDPQEIIDRLYADPVAVIREIQQGAVQATLQQVTPLLDSLVVSDVSRAHNDWQEIGQTVEQLCRERGMTVTQARQTGNLDLIMDAARFRTKGAVSAPAPAPQTIPTDPDEARRLLAAIAAGAGGGAGNAPAPAYDFDDADRAELAAKGISLEEAAALMSGPATLEKRGAKK